MSELQIAQIFARSERFLPVFTSCNAAFRLDERRRIDRWCGNCPKCRFVFLALAPFVEHDRLVAVFGSDLLADPAQLDGYRALLGLEGHRPFECVGEVEESQAALWLIATKSQWATAELVRELSSELAAAGVAVSDATVEAILTPSHDHFVPPAALQALLGAVEPRSRGLPLRYSRPGSRGLPLRSSRPGSLPLRYSRPGSRGLPLRSSRPGPHPS